MRLNYHEAALWVCVDRSEDRRFCGRVLGRRLKEPMPFADFNEFVKKVDALLDIQAFPQAYQQLRTFGIKEQLSVPAVLSKEDLQDTQTVEEYRGEIMTFSLLIVSRQNACWQGRVDWLDETEPQVFRSALELLRFLDGRLPAEYNKE